MLGSARLARGIISSVEDATHFTPSRSDPFPGVERMFLQLSYLLACIGQCTRCSWRSWSWMLTFAVWDVSSGGSGFLGCSGYRMWSGVIRITLWMKLTRIVELFFSFCTFGLRLLKRSFVYRGGALDSTCILNICMEVRSTLMALFNAVNMFLACYL